MSLSIEMEGDQRATLADPTHPEVEAKMRSIRHRVEVTSQPINRIVDQIVAKYSSDLTDLIDRLKTELKRPDRISDGDLENLTLKIPAYLYFASSGLEALGVEGDNAKAVKMELFNELFTETNGTIEDKKKRAELGTFPEYLIEVAFTRAYKKLKTQIDMAEHVFSGVKKVLSKRMLEYEITYRDSPVRGRRPRHDDD